MDAKEHGFVSQNWEILGGNGNMNTILIGIAGGTGSGKTTLTRHLKEHFGKDVTVIGHDSYYKRQVGRTSVRERLYQPSSSPVTWPFS